MTARTDILEGLGYSRFERDSDVALTKLFAEENIRVEHRNVETAYMDMQNGVCVFPIWANIPKSLRTYLTAHETGHWKHTPKDFFKQLDKLAAKLVPVAQAHRNKVVTEADVRSRLQGLFNVVEDVRDDKLRRKEFPGLKNDYAEAYRTLHDRDFFGTKGRKQSTFGLADRINLYFKGGYWIRFKKEEQNLVDRVAKVESVADALALTEELFVYSLTEVVETAKDEFELPQPKQSKDKEEEEQTESVSTPDTLDENKDEQGDTPVKGKGDEKTDDGEKKKKKSKNPPVDPRDQDLPRAETDEAWERNRANLNAGEGNHIEYLDLATPDALERYMVGFKTVLQQHGYKWEKLQKKEQKFVEQQLAKFKLELNASVQYLTAEFNRRKAASTKARVKTSKIGELDIAKIVNYRTDEDIFKTLARVPQGKNHGFLFLVDWSGSMETHLSATLKQLMLFGLFCRAIQVPFEVHIFTNFYQHGWTLNPRNANELGWSCRFGTRCVLSSAMTNGEFQQAQRDLFVMGLENPNNKRKGRFEFEDMGGTPLNPTLLMFSDYIKVFQKATRVDIMNVVIVTDGDDTGSVNTNFDTKAMQTFSDPTFVIRDLQTRREYDLPYDKKEGDYLSHETWSGIDNRKLTGILCNVIKHRTGCNLIGFFITERNAYNLTIDEKIKWEKEGCFSTTNEGFDEYFYVRASTLFGTKVEFGQIDNSISETQREAIERYIGQKFEERLVSQKQRKVLFDKFVARIAEQH
jgi:hypothetical protein